MKSIKLVTENTYLMGYNENNVACCFYPLTKETKELDLPLLPPFKEDEFQKSYQIVFNYVNSGIRNYEAMMELMKLKKIAQAKQFSLEDMIAFGKKCFYKGFDKSENDDANCFTAWKEEANELLQSLSTQQLPKEFILEYEINKHSAYGHKTHILKTIINSDGKEELVGTYKY